MEWDVFLDPHLVKRVEIVLNERDLFLQRKRDAPKKSSCLVSTNSSNDDRSGKTTIAERGDNHHTKDATTSQCSMPPMSSANERLVLSYYNAEIRRRTELLVERMLIAHGNLAQLIMEQTGYFKKYNFSRVKRTRKTLGGGMYARQWLAVYAEAMKLGMGFDGDDNNEEESDSDTDCVDFDNEMDFTRIKEITRVDPPETVSNCDLNGQCVAINPKLKSAKSTLMEVGDFTTPKKYPPAGPPRKIVMMRNDDDDVLTDGSTASESSPRKSARVRRVNRGQSRLKRSTSRTPIPERVEATCLTNASICPDTSISESISILKPIIQCSAPFGLVLDLKSRHVSRRIWALVIDFLRDSGARVEGIGSFFVEEIRDISQYCSSSVNEIVFAHSAGDMQLGCHEGKIRRGDKVFFNAGSLLWDYPNLYDIDILRNILAHRLQPCFDGERIKEGYRLKPYARTTKTEQSSTKIQVLSDGESTCAESVDDDDASTGSDLFTKLLKADRHLKSSSDLEFMYEEVDLVCSTIEDYKNHFQLSIGLYVQEFAIDDAAISLIVKYVNANPHVYDLGLSWGGINGLTVKGIQPGRFTATDGKSWVGCLHLTSQSICLLLKYHFFS